jgi:hypothetical protein
LGCGRGSQWRDPFPTYCRGDIAPGIAPGAVAEMSFKVKADNGDFTGKVTDRSKLLFATMRAMNLWASMSIITKTEWVYQYQPSFCAGVRTL